MRVIIEDISFINTIDRDKRMGLKVVDGGIQWKSCISMTFSLYTKATILLTLRVLSHLGFDSSTLKKHSSHRLSCQTSIFRPSEFPCYANTAQKLRAILNCPIYV